MRTREPNRRITGCITDCTICADCCDSDNCMAPVTDAEIQHLEEFLTSMKGKNLNRSEYFDMVTNRLRKYMTA